MRAVVLKPPNEHPSDEEKENRLRVMHLQSALTTRLGVPISTFYNPTQGCVITMGNVTGKGQFGPTCILKPADIPDGAAEIERILPSVESALAQGAELHRERRYRENFAAAIRGNQSR
jgi:hypothetical protein